MGGRSLLGAVSLLLLSALPADTATLRQCRTTCATTVNDECSDLSRRRLRQCRKRIVRACRRTGLERCLASTTTTTTVTPTSESEPSTTTTSTTTLPTSLCGNGVIDPGEKCDGPSLGDGYCFGGGPVTCLSSCAGWNFSACYSCQNGVREGLEECDGDDIGSATCPVGSTGGSPVCKTSCTLDYTPCIQCGDGDLDGGEFCDDGNTDAHDGCSPTCQSECGDGILEPPQEACDDGGHANGDGCSTSCLLNPVYQGGGDEPDDECALQWGVSSDAGAASTTTCTDGQSPCDRGPAGNESCRFLVFFCMNNPGLHGPCSWSGVARVALVGDSLSGSAALDEDERTVVLDAFATALEWAGGVVSGPNPERAVTPVVTDDICAQFTLDVASGSSRAVAIQIEDDHVPAAVDVDEITLSCTAGG
jgi:cysteine-rich repeat protein